MSTLYDEWLSQQYAEKEREDRMYHPDHGLYSEYHQKDVIVTFSNGHVAQGRFFKTYNKEQYELNVFGNHMHLKPGDIRSIRLAR